MRTVLAPFLVFLLLVSCKARPPGAVDVEQTVAHVQNILQRNPNLPRLDRHQILALLHDIRAKDALFNSTSQETTISVTLPTINDAENEIPKENDDFRVQPLTTEEPRLVLITEKPDKFKQFRVKNLALSNRETKWNEPRIMVVLPFTPSEGTNLDELYTRPPLTAVVSASSLPSSGNLKHVNVIPLSTTSSTSTEGSANKSNNDQKGNNQRETTNENVEPNRKDNVKSNPADKTQNSNQENPIQSQYTDLSAELKEFLDTYGFDRNPTVLSESSPYSDFKPLPTRQILTGSYEEVPEDLLLAYDLLPNSKSLMKPDSYDDYSAIKMDSVEFDGLTSESKLSFAKTNEKGLQKIHNGKDADIAGAASTDSFKVIPLSKGPSPILALSDFNINDSNILFKRQNSDSGKETADSTTITNMDPSTENADSSQDSSTEKQTILDSESDADSTNFKLDNLAATDNNPDSATLEAESPSISDLESSFGAAPALDPSESELPPPRRNGFYFMLDWNSFLEVGDGDNKVNIRFEPKLGDPHMFLPVTVP